MSTIASLEVYRPVLFVREAEESVHQTDDNDFVEKAATMARLLLDQSGKSSVTLRTDNVVRPTVVQATRVYPSLRYVHMRATGGNVKHLANKMVAARMLMEEGRQDRSIQPLATVLGDVAVQEYGVTDNTMFYDLELGRTDVITQQTKDGQRQFVVLRPGREADAEAESPHTDYIRPMLETMSRTAIDYLMNYSSERLHGLVSVPVSDSVPIARVESSDPEKAELLASHIGELLPVTVTVSSELNFESRY